MKSLKFIQQVRKNMYELNEKLKVYYYHIWANDYL